MNSIQRPFEVNQSMFPHSKPPCAGILQAGKRRNCYCSYAVDFFLRAPETLGNAPLDPWLFHPLHPGGMWGRGLFRIQLQALHGARPTLHADVTRTGARIHRGGCGFALQGRMAVFSRGAHKTLPLPCRVRVTNLRNGRSTVIRLNDRGPFVAGRTLDVTEPVAKQLGFYDAGLARVRIEVLSVGDGKWRVTRPVIPRAIPLSAAPQQSL
jgi:hypothetical protein